MPRLTDMFRAGVPLREAPGRTATPRSGHHALAGSVRRPFPIVLVLLALPAFAAIWGGWVSLGEMCGFGPVNFLPGIGHGWTANIAITLPIGMEAYAAYALRVWLSPSLPAPARRFAKVSSIVALVVGALGQTAYHLMAAAGWTHAPWPVTIVVSCIPVAVLGMGAALYHLQTSGEAPETPPEDPAPVSPAPAGLPVPQELPPTREARWGLVEAIRAAHPVITQAGVADMLGVTERTVRNWVPAGEEW